MGSCHSLSCDRLRARCCAKGEGAKLGFMSTNHIHGGTKTTNGMSSVNGGHMGPCGTLTPIPGARTGLSTDPSTPARAGHRCRPILCR